MANHKSAAKRARQNLKRADRNAATLSKVRTSERKLRTAISSKKSDDAKSLLVSFMSQIDKATQKGVLNVKAASRKVGRLSSHVASLGK